MVEENEHILKYPQNQHTQHFYGKLRKYKLPHNETKKNLKDDFFSKLLGARKWGEKNCIKSSSLHAGTIHARRSMAEETILHKTFL